MNRGQAVIAGIFGLALLAAAFSQWYRYRQTHDALDFWGAEAARVIASPERVELWKLERAERVEENERRDAELSVDGQDYLAASRRDVTSARGFLNARQALTVNRSFEWEPSDCDPTWSYALVFTSSDQKAAVILSLDCNWVRLAGSDKIAGIAPIAKGLAILFEEQLGSDKSGE